MQPPSLKKLGRYEVVKPIGKGAWGLVYEAYDPTLDREVAIKTTRVDQLSSDLAAEYESRVLFEYSLCCRLHHPNIIDVHDAGREQGVAYIAMDLVRGGDLRMQLEDGRVLPFGRAVDTMNELLSALGFVHEKAIIHRDIKPANVMLDSDGHVKLGGFHVATILDSGGMPHDRGAMVGTLKYMSPEQVIGEIVDARADLFSAGVVLYKMVTGKKPFDGDSDFAIMQAITQQDPPPPSSFNPRLPVGIDAVAAKALVKDRNRRYASASDFSDALLALK